MSIKKAYNSWSEIYDTNKNRTRDLDKSATRIVLGDRQLGSVLELGCGTGKNTEWLVERASSITAIDFSEGMLRVAKEKVKSEKVTWKQADVTLDWDVADDSFDLITCSLILEHIEDLGFIFSQANAKLKPGGLFFISELHPFKQYAGTKAKYETENGVEELQVYIHHVSEFTDSGKLAGYEMLELEEWFDEDDEKGIPRLISFLFQKK